MDNKLLEILNTKQNLIFDFDGTIADNEYFHFLTHKEILAKYGYDLTEEIFIKCIVHNNPNDIQKNLENYYNTKFENANEYEQDYYKIYSKNIEGLKPFRYVLDIFKNFPDKNFVVLSNEQEGVIKSHLEEWGFFNNFSRIVSCNRSFSKEYVFENFEEFFGFSPQDSVMFEDSAKNLSLAKNAGLTTVGVEHLFNKNKLIADYIIEYEK